MIQKNKNAFPKQKSILKAYYFELFAKDRIASNRITCS